MSGGCPSHDEWIITCTSEMSGRASKGIRRSDQIPASVSKRVPVKTRKRLRAHQSIQWEITLHFSFNVHAYLFIDQRLPVFLSHDRHLPGSAAFQLAPPFIDASTFVAEVAHHTHGTHAHCGHGRHKERDSNLGAGYWRAGAARQLYAKCVTTSAGRRWQSGEISGCLVCRRVDG